MKLRIAKLIETIKSNVFLQIQDNESGSTVRKRLECMMPTAFVTQRAQVEESLIWIRLCGCKQPTIDRLVSTALLLFLNFGLEQISQRCLGSSLRSHFGVKRLSADKGREKSLPQQ